MKTQIVAVILLVNLLSAGAALAKDDQFQAGKVQQQSAAVNQPRNKRHNKHQGMFVIKNATVAGELYNIVFPANDQTEMSTATGIIGQNPPAPRGL